MSVAAFPILTPVCNTWNSIALPVITVKEPVIIALFLTVKVSAEDAVAANVAYEADRANDAVPNNEPVNPRVEVTDPENTDELDTNNEPDTNTLPLTSKAYPAVAADCLPIDNVPPKKFVCALNCLTRSIPPAKRVLFIVALPFTVKLPVISTLPVN